MAGQWGVDRLYGSGAYHVAAPQACAHDKDTVIKAQAPWPPGHPQCAGEVENRRTHVLTSSA